MSEETEVVVGVVSLSMDQAWHLRKPLRGSGGFQMLMKKLRSQVVMKGDEKVLELFEEDIERMRRYCKRYGGGGYQGRIHSLLQGVRRL